MRERAERESGERELGGSEAASLLIVVVCFRSKSRLSPARLACFSRAPIEPRRRRLVGRSLARDLYHLSAAVSLSCRFAPENSAKRHSRATDTLQVRRIKSGPSKFFRSRSGGPFARSTVRRLRTVIAKRRRNRSLYCDARPRVLAIAHCVFNRHEGSMP